MSLSVQIWPNAENRLGYHLQIHALNSPAMPPLLRSFERMSLVTSARFCAVERAWSRGGQGRPVAREAEAESALVTAYKSFLYFDLPHKIQIHRR